MRGLLVGRLPHNIHRRRAPENEVIKGCLGSTLNVTLDALACLIKEITNDSKVEYFQRLITFYTEFRIEVTCKYSSFF